MLRAEGCRAGGYRLLAADGTLSPFCCVHLYADWRLITTYEPARVMLIALGQHDGTGFYQAAASDLGIGPVGQRRPNKPPCCGPSGRPNVEASAAPP